MATAKTKTKKTPAKSRSQASRAQAPAKRAASKSKANAKADGSLLETFFIDALKDIYWAEKALTKTLPKMMKNATSEELKQAFEDHLSVTEGQIERLDQVFEAMGKKAQGKKCEAMAGLIAESEDIISETKDDTITRDAALIIAAQKVEHYEIASYGGLVQLATTLNKTDVAKLLQATLDEEKEADVLLTKIAEQGGINAQASQEEGANGTSLKDSIMSVFSK